MADIAGVLVGLIWVAIAVGGLVLFIWALVDVLRTNFRNDTHKILWILVVLLATFIGPVLWLVWGRKNA
jgi:beta-lactamase regulating signal transducer with metallopeptidase domain